ncbi:MFS transporter [Jeotgalibacillus malaysiensis]|uniref:MFS transporter n=1 Tax=Jeotgalibacillus malaysiensis TaxID=1508404 RepID=A0A0B5ARN7_9BACL|nr:hypothetical protein [Jeotgalibacillus malaysiensis]AJD92925.1 MFS transporter [Jeotgalibacillus malaysiensis]
MWVILGVIAIAVTFLNLYLFTKGKDYKLAMALGLSFTALTLCAEYSMVSDWVAAEDWGALMDVVPTMEWALWLLTIVSILLNITPVILEKRRK